MAQAAADSNKSEKKKSRVKFGGKHIIIEPKSDHTATIIWCHGLGDTGAGWQPSMYEIAAKYPYIRFVLPTAPTMPITMNGGMAMPGWHDIESLTNLMKNKFEYKEDTKILLTDLVDDEIKLLETNLLKNKKLKIDSSDKEIMSNLCNKRVLLGGFSQGAAMSIYTGLCYDKCSLAGIISLSGYLCDFSLFQKFSKKQYPNLNVLMYHGKNDMIVQTAFGNMSYEYLKNVCQLKNIEFKLADVPQWMNIGHGTTEEEMNDVADYIGKWLPKEWKIEGNSGKNDKNSKNSKDSNEKSNNSNNSNDNSNSKDSGAKEEKTGK